MPETLEERVAYLEGRVEEHSKAWEDLKDMIISLDHKVDRRIDSLSNKSGKWLAQVLFKKRLDRFPVKLRRFSYGDRLDRRRPVHSL